MSFIRFRGSIEATLLHFNTYSYSCLFSLIKNCKAKCLFPENYPSMGDLNKGESVCIDRCINKYFSVLELTSKELEAKGMQASAGRGALGN